MRSFWSTKFIYRLISYKRKWLYGLASLTFFGSGCSLHYLGTKEINNVKIKRKVIQVLKDIFSSTSLLSAIVDWEEWLISDYLPSTSEYESLWDSFVSDYPWILLEFTKSSNPWLRQVTVETLANTKWEDYKARIIAQACDPRTSVSLARYTNANNAFFLQPPRLHSSENCILTDLCHQLTLLPTPQSESSISYSKTIALDKEVEFEDTSSLDLEGPLYTIPGEKEEKEEKRLIFCLQAILEYSAVEEYGHQFVENHGLAVLQRLLSEHSELWVNIYVASIIKNLTLHRHLLEDLVRTGWLYVMRKWASNEDTNLSLLALTALANLDKDWIDRSLYQDTILIHPTNRTRSVPKADIVFVHGLRGGAVMTWRQQDGSGEEISQCWPRDWLAADCPNIRILSIGYSSFLHLWGDYLPVEQDKHTLKGRGQDLIKKLKQANVGARPIIWIGHSLGGLLIKEILVQSTEESETCDLRSKTKGIIMYSVPHHGSSVVDNVMYAKYLFFPSIEVQELITSSTQLKELHDQFRSIVAYRSVPVLSFGETLKTDFGTNLFQVMVVPQESSDPEVGQYVSLPVNHINSCKPFDRTDPIYQNTVSFIKKIVDN